MENRLYELSRIELPIYDGNTKVEHGFTIRLPFEVLKQYYPAPAIKIYAPDADFIAKPILLEAWTLKDGQERMKKETTINSKKWMTTVNYKQRSAIYWPPMQWREIYDFKTDIMIAIQPVKKEYNQLFLALISSACW
jgi:hypothetical protein